MAERPRGLNPSARRRITGRIPRAASRVRHAANRVRRAAGQVRRAPGRVPDLELPASGHRLVPDPVVGGRRRDLQVAATPEPGVDSLLPAERLDPIDRIARRAGHSQRRLHPPSAARMFGNENHIDVAEPPIPPAGPMPTNARPPATPRSRSGSSFFKCQAAHIPVYPPPITTTSALRSPFKRRQRLDLSSLLKPVAMGGVLHLRSSLTGRTGVAPTMPRGAAPAGWSWAAKRHPIPPPEGWWWALVGATPVLP